MPNNACPPARSAFTTARVVIDETATKRCAGFDHGEAGPSIATDADFVGLKGSVVTDFDPARDVFADGGESQ